MKCPFCAARAYCSHTIPRKDDTYRRYKCRECDSTFYTSERLEVVKVRGKHA